MFSGSTPYMKRVDYKFILYEFFKHVPKKDEVIISVSKANLLSTYEASEIGKCKLCPWESFFPK